MMDYQDPTVTAREYLTQRITEPVFLDEPDSDTYDYRKPCVLIQDVGSRVLYQGVFLDAFLSFDVRADTRENAERLARRVFAVMREWGDRDSSIVPQDDKDFPKWNPEADRRIPSYTFTYRAWFRPSTQNS